jgi:hypothetical protein
LRPVYLALEQIIENNIQQSNLPVKFLAPSSGKTMHINTRGEFLIPGFNSVVEGFAKNIIPQRQQMEEHNFINSFWN